MGQSTLKLSEINSAIDLGTKVLSFDPLMEAEGWPIKNTSVDDLIDLVDALATLGFFSAGSPGTVVLPLLSTFSNAMAAHSTAPQSLIKSELFLSCGF